MTLDFSMDFRSTMDRMKAVAEAAGRTPTEDVAIVQDAMLGGWWLVGCAEDDMRISGADDVLDVEEALRCAERALGLLGETP